MGIQGLLPFVRKAWQETDLSRFAGATVAVDIYCWIHKGAFACAEALALGKPTDQYVHYCIKLIKLLHRFHLKPILVFDGKNLPSKAAEEEKRRQKREENRRRAARCLSDGRRSEAREYFERCVDVTPEMALSVMKAARELGVDCLVAPYESDAQIAFLCQRGGIADLAITNDSDLLPFGCERVFFKLELSSGRGILIEREQLLAEGFPISGGLSGDRFRHMCILSGCDYYPGVNGVGLVTAAKVMSRTRLGDLPSLLSKLRMYLPKNEAAQLTPDEKESLLRAERTFLYQIVFDPINRKQVPVTPYPRNLSPEDVSYAGKVEKDEKRAIQLALGNINFKTGTECDRFDPVDLVSKSQNLLPHMRSIWDLRYKPRSIDQRKYEGKKVELPLSSPQCQSGREKVMTVTYHPPKMPASSSDSKLLCTKKSKLRSEDSQTDSTIFSQYFSKTSENQEKVSERYIEEKEASNSDTESSLFSSSVSPVFHRSHNKFAVHSPTSPSENNSKVSHRTRPRFSLDKGLGSIFSSENDRPKFSLDDEPGSKPTSKNEPSNTTGCASEQLDGSFNLDSANFAEKNIISLSSSTVDVEYSHTSSISHSKSKRVLSPSKEMNVMTPKEKRNRISSPVISKSSILNWLSTSDAGSTQGCNNPVTAMPKACTPEGRVKKKAVYRVSSKELFSKKGSKSQNDSTKGSGMVSQMMSLWKKADKEKLHVSQDDDEVIVIS